MRGTRGLLAALAVLGSAAGAAVQVNLAAGCDYELLTRRSYGASRESDLTILTDGAWANGYWTRENTLAWRPAPGQSADVMVDLGERRAIAGVVVAAVRGVAAHPPMVAVWVSDDMARFRKVVEWDAGVGLEVAPQAPSTERSQSPEVRAAGRYVLVQMTQPGDAVTGAPRSGLICVTEVEVLTGDFDPAGATSAEGEMLELEAYLRARDPLRFIPPVNGEFETPHVDWAPKPAGGRPRVLTVLQYVCGRDAVELEQRVGMEQRIFALLRQTPRMDLITTRELLAALEDAPDVLVLAGIDAKIMREQVRARIAELVRGGMGLVWVHPRGETEELAELLAALPEAEFGVLDAEQVPWPVVEGEVRAGTVGAGRVVTWRYENADGERFVEMNSALWPQCAPGTNEPEDFAYWEIYAARLAKMVCWAAHGEAAARLAPVEITRADRDGMTLRVRATGTTDELRVRARLVDEHNRVTTEAIGEPAGAIEFAGPLQTGPHAAMVWLEDAQGRQLDWRVAIAEINGPRITAVRTDRDRYERGDTVGVAVSWEGAATEVTGELVDAYGGVAANAADDGAAGRSGDRPLRTADGGEVVLELGTERARSLVCMLHVELWDVDGLLDEWFGPVPTIDEPELDEYTVGLWSSYGSYIGKRHWGYEMLRSQLPLMVDLAIAGPMPAYPRFDMRPCPENMHRIFFKLGERYENMNLAAPGFREEFLEAIRPRIEGGYRWGAYDFSVGDECGYTLRRDDDTLAAFREWLRVKYGEIAALNSAWNAAFAHFDEVSFEPEPADPEVISHAPGLDERLFGDWLFADTLMAARREAEAIDARNRLGISGTRDPAHYVGFDWWRLMDTLTHLSFYDGLQRECIRSWMKPGDLITSFVGYDDADINEVGARYFPWLEAFTGVQGVSIYSASSGDLGGFVRPDLTLTRRARWLGEEVAELKGGVGRALLTAERTRAPIALHYSQRSIHLGKMLGRPTVETLISAAELIKDIGLQFDMISHEQLEEGVLGERGYRAMVLADSPALSDAEVAALREFADAGGLVLSFGESGTHDGNGRMREADPLEGLATACAEPVAEYREFRAGGVGGETTERLSASAERSAAWQARMEEVLSPAAIAAPAVVRNADGSPRRYVEVVEFARGRVRYVGVLPRYFGGRYSRGTEPQHIEEEDFTPATIELAEDGHVYDVRAGEYVGETDTIEARLATGVAALYAVLPYPVTGVQVECAEAITVGETLRVRCTVETDGAQPGDHVVHVELADPRGNVIRPYARNVLAAGGTGEVAFALPLNAAAGEWTVSAREVASGARATATVTAREQDGRDAANGSEGA